ncbi:MAG: putative sugar nucleotidyl transferase, partial [Cyclobacteriaceae bacterium]|nr:putative sugar nucleotidyl transferase [Cyclobacteriaceae bacterium]
MNYILFDDLPTRTSLLPLTHLRPVADIRVGICKISEKWERVLGTTLSFYTVEYLSGKYTCTMEEDNVFINGAVCPDELLVQEIQSLEKEEILFSEDQIIAVRARRFDPSLKREDRLSDRKSRKWKNPVTIIDKPWKIFQHNAVELKKDFIRLTRGRKSAGISDKATVVYGEENVFVEEGVSIKSAVIDAENGPVYLGKHSVVHPGAVIRGSFALLEYSQVSMGAKMRGDTTVGPHSKVGGEVANSVIFGYSNKSHEGYLGNSVIAEWCNLGADTNTSNMKNDYGPIKLWDYNKERFTDTGIMFCGLIMGDHSKTGINTMFNSGTSVGVSCNITGSGYPRAFIPSFSKGGPSGYSTWT